MVFKSAHNLLLSSVIILALGMGGLLCGIVSEKWYVSKYTWNFDEQTKIFSKADPTEINFGLLRWCQKTIETNKVHCLTRRLFTFSSTYIWKLNVIENVLDQILLLLIVSSGFAIISFAFLLMMGLCCDKNNFRWKILALVCFFLTGISAILALSAAGISDQYIFKNLQTANYPYQNVYHQGWTSSIVWCGAASLVISTFNILLLIYITPFNKHKETENELRCIENVPVYTIENDSSVLYTNENLYSEAFSSVDDNVLLSIDFFNAVDNLPPPPTYNEASRSQGKPPKYSEAINNPSSDQN